ncbi:response regulator [Flavobacterium chuncheonense]|uniref:Response regulator n=1 Tax=Flavobacterium chuncheonense TaxID=2026653 RepID=A0ABW5YK38_9FLAO
MKILVAEDIDSISLGIQKAIQEYKDFEIVHARYCDEALLKFKKAELDGQPFDLIISDLSFKTDYKENVLQNGSDLVKAIRTINQIVPIIVYSIEDKTYVIKNLFELNDINGYVLKGRNSTTELLEAIKTVLAKDKYISREINHVLQRKNTLEIEQYDIFLLEKLANGLSQSEISNDFNDQEISPSSVSAIEKRINKLKIQFQAKNSIQLVALVKDLGII